MKNMRFQRSDWSTLPANLLNPGRLTGLQFIQFLHFCFIPNLRKGNCSRKGKFPLLQAVIIAGRRGNCQCIVPLNHEKRMNGHSQARHGSGNGLQLIVIQLESSIYYNVQKLLCIIQALTRKGISVPRDISVISFDNLPYSGMIFPPLTTIELPSASLGSTACKMLISMIEGKFIQQVGIIFDFQGKLIDRESVRHIHTLS